MTIIANQDLPWLKDSMAFVEQRLLKICSHITLPQPLKAGIVMKRSRLDALAFVRVGDPQGTCNVTGEPLPWWGRKYLVSHHMTDGEIVQTLFLAARVAMEHELREGFKYQGQAVFDPHFDIEKLVSLRAAAGAIRGREEGL